MTDTEIDMQMKDEAEMLLKGYARGKVSKCECGNMKSYYLPKCNDCLFEEQVIKIGDKIDG